MKRFITWLYVRFVYMPQLKKKLQEMESQKKSDFVIQFEPDPAMDAQVEKSTRYPRVH